MDTDTKNPDVEDKSRGRSREESLYFQSGPYIGYQIAVNTLEDGAPTGEAWILELTPANERRLKALVKEFGVHIRPGVAMLDEKAVKEAIRKRNLDELKRGDQVVCEVCGDATFGIMQEDAPDDVLAAFSQPDEAGRVFLQGDVIAVCSKSACLEAADVVWDATVEARLRKNE